MRWKEEQGEVGMRKETRHKLRLIKKYAKIRFKRFWSEWGITKNEFADFLASVAIIAIVVSLSIVLG